ncbi:MAG: winged helix-turn-helix domain-containing protein [Solirubrobacteraceae bacterium]
MTFAEAAENVLRKERRPMTAKEITEIALARKLIRSQGKTPTATMTAALYGLPAASPIEREFVAGAQRAKRDSVRWRYVAEA